MEKIISTIAVFFGSIVKFSVFTLTAIATDLGLGGSLANVIGGIIGIVLFTYLGTVMQEYMIRKFPRRFARKFTRSNRFLVKVKQKFGLNGIAVLTPIILSIPVGVLFALTLTHDKKKIMFTMITSMLFWAIVLFLPYYLFDINIVVWIKRMFA